MIRAFIRWNIRISNIFDKKFMPASYLIDGNSDFIEDFVPKYIQQNMKIYDVGGGKKPYVESGLKERFNLSVAGIDISRKELLLAPEGIYDEIVCADICDYSGNGDGDLVICQAVLEHVENTHKAIQSISSLIKYGGTALIFVPSRNAVFARLNNVLPQKLKKKILYFIYPSAKENQGFPSFYDQCTPKDFERIASENNLTVIEAREYYISGYFNFCFPVYFLWRIWILLFKMFRGRQAAETFSIALRKQK